MQSLSERHDIDVEDAGEDRGDPLPLAVRRSPLWRWATPALSLAIAAAVFYELRYLHFDEVRALIPTSPLFWIVFVIFYVSPIAFDFLIFKRLWNIPVEGFVALTRKLVSNELLLSYVGEVYFYGWARKKLHMATSPFGAIKDVAIMSALVGNGCTLAMMAIAYPFMGRLRLSVASETIVASVGVLVVISILAFVFSSRLFSLTKAQLIMVASTQFVRIAVATVLIALMWSIALPLVAPGMWLLLATARLLLGRLPLFTNKEVLFAGVAVVLIGRTDDIAAMIALMTTIILTAHVVVGAGLAIGDFVTINRNKPESIS